MICIGASIGFGCAKQSVTEGESVIQSPTTEFALVEELGFGNTEAEGAPLFERIAHVSVDDDGLIYVTDVGATTVVVVGSDGRTVRNIGSRGQGPGEFEYVSSTTISGDSVIAWLPFKGASVFNRRTGEYRGQYVFPEMGSYAAGQVVAQDGRYFLSNVNDGRPNNAPNKLIRFALDEAEVQTVLTLPSSEVLMGSNGSITFPDYLRRPQCASANQKVYCGFNDGLRFAVATVGGDSLGVLEVEYSPVRISTADRAAFESRYAGSEFASDLDIPENWPAFDWFIGDDRGRLWITVLEARDDSTSFWIVDPAKRTTARTRVLGRIRPFVVAKDKLYGTLTDATGDVRVARFAIKE